MSYRWPVFRVLALTLAVVPVLAHAQVTKADAAQSGVVSANARIQQHQVEVQHLQTDLTQQESQSKQVAERLRQQDQAIEQLQQQLKALQAQKAPTNGH
jgi:septal ring factor EnvC (AmiA/AmiB activator)